MNMQNLLFFQKLFQMIQPEVQMPKPDYYRNGNGVILMQSPELLPFYGSDKTETNTTNTINCDVDNNRTHSHEVYTQDETTCFPIGYESKTIFGNGSVDMHQDNDVSNNVKSSPSQRRNDLIELNDRTTESFDE